jgi:hypothetical protein
MQGNAKGSAVTGLHANENYAREIMQLFSIGLYRLWPDGSYVLDSTGNPVATYTQANISGMAQVLTGWTYWQALQGNGRLPVNFFPPADYVDPMVLVPTQHDLSAKPILDNVVLPAAIGYNPIGSPTAGSQADPSVVAFDTYCSQDLEKAIDNVFYNQNVGPFVCRELIQRLVESNPSPGYLYRVTQAFNDDGSASHVRGNMQAVINAILLDYEARSTAAQTASSGKQREPVLRITGPARAFPAAGFTGTYSQNATNASPQQITITTTTANRLNNGDTVFLNFADSSVANGIPTSQAYGISNVTAGANTFTINATGLTTGATYNQVAGSNTLTITNASGYILGASVYLKFVTATSGTIGTDGIYTLATVAVNTLTVTMPDTLARAGALIIPRLTGGYVVSNSGLAAPNDKLITVSTSANDNLNVNDTVYLNFQATGTGVNGVYTVYSIVDNEHFTVTTTGIGNQTQNNTVIYPLVPPPLTRTGNLAVQESTWNIGYSSFSQTPLNSPTVFNFFYPGYAFPGILANHGLTTPEFQLTTDSNLVTLTNVLSQGILSAGNPNGFTSFFNGGGAIVMDLSTYMTTGYTSNANIPTLVTELNNRLMGGTMSASLQTAIANYVTGSTAGTANFAYTIPTSSEMSKRVRAVVQMILISPEYSIQR